MKFDNFIIASALKNININNVFKKLVDIIYERRIYNSYDHFFDLNNNSFVIYERKSDKNSIKKRNNCSC